MAAVIKAFFAIYFFILIQIILLLFYINFSFFTIHSIIYIFPAYAGYDRRCVSQSTLRVSC